MRVGKVDEKAIDGSLRQTLPTRVRNGNLDPLGAAANPFEELGLAPRAPRKHPDHG